MSYPDAFYLQCNLLFGFCVASFCFSFFFFSFIHSVETIYETHFPPRKCQGINSSTTFNMQQVTLNFSRIQRHSFFWNKNFSSEEFLQQEENSTPIRNESHLKLKIKYINKHQQGPNAT